MDEAVEKDPGDSSVNRAIWANSAVLVPGTN